MKPLAQVHTVASLLAHVAWVSACAGGVGLAVAADKPASRAIYACVDASGQHLTSDRPIPECLDRVQRVLGTDGAPRRTVLPRLSPAELALLEEQQRQQAAQDEALREHARRDRNLLSRFPNEAVHQRARQLALDDVRQALAVSERRLLALKEARKPLLLDADFYQGKPKPAKLKAALDANEMAAQAQFELIANSRAELQRLHGLFDAELAHLKALWAGALPGTVGTPERIPAAVSPASSSASH